MKQVMFIEFIYIYSLPSFLSYIRCIQDVRSQYFLAEASKFWPPGIQGAKSQQKTQLNVRKCVSLRTQNRTLSSLPAL